MNTFSVTDLRHKTSDVIAAAQASGYVHLIDKKSPVSQLPTVKMHIATNNHPIT